MTERRKRILGVLFIFAVFAFYLWLAYIGVATRPARDRRRQPRRR
jgi:hypothetical protein